MAASAIILYNSARKFLCDGTFDLNGDTFTVVLLNSSYVPLRTHTTFADMSAYELATAYGYDRAARKTATLADASWDTTTAPTAPTLNFPNISWNVSGGTVTAKWAALVEMSGSNYALCFVNLDTTGASADGFSTPGGTSVSCTTGNTLTLSWPTGLTSVTDV